MNSNICNICGANYEYINGKWKCRYCGSYKPDEITNEESTLLYIANQRLRMADFDEAEKQFSDIIEKFPKSTYAYWGRVLAKYGIKYEDDFDGRKIPTCYATSMECFTSDSDYLKALDFADADTKEFYQKLRQKGSVSTSAVAMDRFTEFFEGFLKDGVDVLYLGFSSGLSGTYNAAFVASQELSEKYPDRKVYTVDTLCASLGQGLFVYLAAKEKAAGKTIDELYEWAKEQRYHLCHWFTVDDLFFLKRGGRVSGS